MPGLLPVDPRGLEAVERKWGDKGVGMGP